MSERVRGMASWNPQRKTQALLDQVEAVLDEYSAHLPLTIRQIFYRLVGKYGYGKTEKAYNRLAEHLNRARRAEIIAFEDIRDDGVTCNEPGGFASVKSFWSSVEYTAQKFRLDRLAGQDLQVELWVEAAGMVPQMAKVAHPYGIPVYSSSGFVSTTANRETAERLSGGDAVVLHVGDLDPSGVAIFDALESDVEAFMEDISPGSYVQFERIAVTPEQAKLYHLPTAPPKRTDPRSNYQGATVQAEALPPDVLASEVQAAILKHVDEETWQATLEREAQERTGLVQQIKELSL